MKIIRTANLTVLKTWLIGGQVTEMGLHSDGFHCLDPRSNDCDIKYVASNELVAIEEIVRALITEYGDDPSCNQKGFYYYGDLYRFKMPCEKNLRILVGRIYDAIKGA